MLLLPLLTRTRAAPGMTSWVCRSCANPNVLFSAEARVLAPGGGEVGRLRLVQSLPRDERAGSPGPVMIDVSYDSTLQSRGDLETNSNISYVMEGALESINLELNLTT